MRSKAALWKTTAIAAFSTLLSFSLPAQADSLNNTPSAGAMVADAVVVRPLYFALSQAGAVLYTATLPFTLLGGNADKAAETLVVTPLQGAFIRCLGCGKIENQVGRLSEADGSKTIKHFLQLGAGASLFDFNGDNESTTSFSVHAGTHFSLSDGSRFDISLGAAQLGSLNITQNNERFEDDLMSYQIVTRFGRKMGVFDLMFHIGGHYYDLDRDFTDNGSNKSSGSEDGFGLLGGVGLDLWLSDSVRAGLQYTHYGVSKLPDEYKSHFGNAQLNLAFMF